jgi:hypothetical protein
MEGYFVSGCLTGVSVMMDASLNQPRACGAIGRLLVVVHALKTRPMIATLFLGFAIQALISIPAEARGGGHHFLHSYPSVESRGSHFAAGRRYGNDQYAKASSERLDKLLATKLKSICRGC